jgi:hypothetical protein
MSDDDSGQDYAEGVDVPDFPGPNALGHTPVIGSVRRSNDLPVIRDRAAEEVDELDAVDLPDEPLLPILNTE